MAKADEDFNIALAKLVEKYPCLYDFTRKDYNNCAVREAAWLEISTEINEGVEDCKLRWKSLRGCITRDKKIAKRGNKSKRPYYLQEYLQFVKPFTRATSRTSRASVQLISYPSDSEDHGSFEGNTHNQSSPVLVQLKDDPSKLKIDQLKLLQKHDTDTFKRPRCEEYEDNNNPDLTFFKSLLPDISRMNHRQKSSFRLGVVTLIDQVLYGPTDQTQFAEQQSSPSCSTVVSWSS